MIIKVIKMDYLPVSAIVINKLNDEFNELYDEKQSVEKENDILIFTLTDILFNLSFETIDSDKDYQVNQMYDIIKALKNHESYDMIYWFERHNINDATLQKKILNNLLEKIKNFCNNIENNTFNKEHTDLELLMNDFNSKTLYLRDYNLANDKLEFTTRLVLPNPYWETIIESSSDYEEYFEDLICPKTMSNIKECSCKTCCYINKKVESIVD